MYSVIYFICEKLPKSKEINMKKIKLIAIDLDETLLTTDKRVQEDDLDALNKAREKGVVIVFSSGRHLDGMKPILGVAGKDAYCISSAGAVITDSSDKVVFSSCIAPEKVHSILGFIKEKGFYAQGYPPAQKFLYAERCDWTDIYEEKCKCTGICRPDMFEAEDIESSKILILGDPEALKPLQKELRDMYPGHPVVFSQPTHLEILQKGVSKGDSLEILCDMLGIDISETMGIGDSEVDLPLIETAGIGACPANSMEIIKKNSDYISPLTNNECAVAEILNRFVLGE